MDTPKIIQLLKLENDPIWQGSLLGLADDGLVYELNKQGNWIKFIPPSYNPET